MIDADAPFSEQLLDVPVAKCVGQVPADSLQDDRLLEVPALERDTHRAAPHHERCRYRLEISAK
jgi:hypothetical protein